MSKSNIQIVREYIEVVVNQKRFDQVFTYCHKDCIIHSPPYIGLGVGFDDRTGKELVIIETAPNGPAAGHLLPGDEVVRVTEGEKTLSTFEELNNSVWPLGVSGTSITVTVRRNGKLLDIPILRGRVEGFDMNLSTYVNIWRDSVLKYWPDLTAELIIILGANDLVTCYLINSGTNQEFHHSAVWSEFDLFRLQDGKITEMWGMEDRLQQMMQLGYEMKEPAKEIA